MPYTGGGSRTGGVGLAHRRVGLARARARGTDLARAHGPFAQTRGRLVAEQLGPRDAQRPRHEPPLHGGLAEQTLRGAGAPRGSHRCIAPHKLFIIIKHILL